MGRPAHDPGVRVYGVSIRRWRLIARNWSQEKLAEAIGVSRSTVANWERETRNPNRVQLEALAKALGCSIEDLCTPPPEAR